MLIALLAAHAAQLTLTPEQICTHADRVAVVTIQAIDAGYVGRDIERVVTAEVVQAVKNTEKGELLFTLKGGRIEEDMLWVEDQPNLLVGATYLLALDGPKADALVFGGYQGAVRILPTGSRIGTPLDEALEAMGACNAR